MALSFCPGSSQFRQPKPESIKCPSCNGEVEIWSDEIQAICPHCKESIVRAMDTSCLDWCRYAKECVGDKSYSKYIQNKAALLMKALEDYFGNDQKRINHAKKVMHFAEELLKKERGDWHIVIPASILHDVGIKAAEEKYGSAAGRHQEKEGPEIARKMLNKMGFKKEYADEICAIIAHHHTPGAIDTLNFKVLYDADRMVNLKEEVSINDKEMLQRAIEKSFLTESGKELAKKVYLNG